MILPKFHILTSEAPEKQIQEIANYLLLLVGQLEEENRILTDDLANLNKKVEQLSVALSDADERLQVIESN